MKAISSFVLCATDFSSHAHDAATVAAKLALRRGENLRLVHATDSPGEGMRALLQERLEKEVARLQTLGVAAEAILLEGARPSGELLASIEREPPSLVVVGCAGKGVIDRWALGSFSERIAERSPVPTLIVRNPAIFEAWDWTKSRLTVLLALDFHASSDVVLRWAKEFRRTGPCDLVACHVNWRTPALGDPPTIGAAVNGTAVQHRLEQDLQKKVRDQIGDDAVETIVQPCFGDPGPSIVEIAERRKAQLIAIGAHQRRGLRRLAQFSVSREVLHLSTMNVVCVPISAQFDAHEAHIPDFRRVLVTTDFSELGNAAVPYACAVSGTGGIVRIIHVTPPRRAARRVKPNGASELEEKLRALVPNEAVGRCHPVQVDVLENGDVPKAICREAERFGADVVCLASHGLGGSRGWHGSVAKAVLKQLKRPLLIIRRPDE